MTPSTSHDGRSLRGATVASRAVKNPGDVGADFDEYASRWRKEDYGLETGYTGDGVLRDGSRSELVQRPGDEWGDVAPLRDAYRSLIDRFGPKSGSINVVEIGAGGGRSTAVLLELLGTRCDDYHIVDVSAGFVRVLEERIDRPLDIHIVGDIDLGQLPAEHFDICLAQSSWSHINLYDQYRYLRELRRVLRPDGVVYVSGQFLIGVGSDWTWDRFRRRVYQIDHGTEGVFHEFTSVAALAEMLTRLGYETCCINSAGFVARRGPARADRGVTPLSGPITFPFNPSPHDFLRTGRTQTITLPTVVAADQATTPEGSGSEPSSDYVRRARNLAKRVPGLRPAVLRARALRRDFLRRSRST